MNSSPDPALFVEKLSPAMRQAAAIARALEGRVQNQPKRDEPTAVKQALTVADTATQEALLVPLLEAFPGVRLEAEEDTETVHRFSSDSESLVIVDPIDGTLHSYLEGAGPYGVMVGLTIAGRYEAGLVALPREGLFFDAVRGGGARRAKAGGERRPAKLRNEGRRVLVNHGMSEAAVESLRDSGFEVTTACGGAVSVAPLIPGVRAGLRVHDSPIGVSIRGRIGALVAAEAGCQVRGADRGPFPLDLETRAPVLAVAASAEDLDPLYEALAAAGFG